ncbi:hypothetical protein LOK49_Contig29G00006 [Camellia lanceoleosa]|nr:hypothetical protein LOK49_Contig29G00006 [Camellia lanceoleosa]
MITTWRIRRRGILGSNNLHWIKAPQRIKDRRAMRWD